MISKIGNMDRDKPCVINCGTVLHRVKQLPNGLVLLTIIQAESSSFTFLLKGRTHNNLQIFTNLQFPTQWFRVSAILDSVAEHQYQTPRIVIFLVLYKPI